MIEVVYDGLIGPTYSFAGLSHGNRLSQAHSGSVSSPKRAALQSLAKMKALADRGIAQAIIPPQERPDLSALRRLGFSGNDAQVLEIAARSAPEILAACSAATSAWSANTAVITSSSDKSSSMVHITPANLASRFHRSLETEATVWLMLALFPDPDRFVHLEPLPSHADFGDEGQGNVLRLGGDRGVYLWGFGRTILSHTGPTRFPARQTDIACQALARLHQLSDDRVVMGQIHPELIDAGAFHQDLLVTGHNNLLLYYEDTWIDTDRVLSELSQKLDLQLVQISRDELPIKELLQTYLLNSQFFSTDSGLLWVLPEACQDHPVVGRVCGEVEISEVLYVDVSESIKNGGGPACMSLRARLTEEEFSSCYRDLYLHPPLYGALVEWVEEHYRDELRLEDLGDPGLLLESRQALDVLTELLDLGPLYPFQQG